MSENTNYNNKILLTLPKILSLFSLLITLNISVSANECANEIWLDEHWYEAGDRVEFDDNIYVAVYDNPGYNPAIYDWFWEWKSSSGSCDYSKNNSASDTCLDNDFVDGKWYDAGDKVNFDNNTYIAVIGNHGYNPKTTSWFWDLYSTTTQSCIDKESTNNTASKKKTDNSSCADEVWLNEHWYDAGTTVEFNENIYTAIYDNPGYNPSINNWFWKWKSSAGSCDYSTNDDPTKNICDNDRFVNDQWYDPGYKVEFNGKIYIAVIGSHGKIPQSTAWFWNQYSTDFKLCNTNTSKATYNETAPIKTSNNINNVISINFSNVSDCGTEWHSANLTTHSSYPDKSEPGCSAIDSCPWLGQFKNLPNEVRPESWVKQNNIIAVHSKHFEWLKGKSLKIRQGTKEITATVYDECSDADCDGCCSTNLGSENFLIDMEKNTMQRFGSYYGSVEWQICD